MFLNPVLYCIVKKNVICNSSIKICLSKTKSNSDKIWTIWKKGKFNSEMIWKIWKKSKLNSEKIWKLWIFFFFNVRCVIVIRWFAVLFLIFVWPWKGPLEYDGWIHDVTSCLLWRHRWMTLYAKPINRPFLLEGWFEKPKHRLFGHVLQVFQIWYNLCWELTSTWTFKIYLHNRKKKKQRWWPQWWW